MIWNKRDLITQRAVEVSGHGSKGTYCEIGTDKLPSATTILITDSVRREA